jgi:hypothetical protein
MNRSTLIALVLFGALLAGWFVLSRRPDKGEGVHLTSPRLKVTLAEMDTLQIVRPGRPKVVLKKTSKAGENGPAGKWMMITPVQYEADSFPMRALVEKLADLDLGDTVTTNPDRLTDLGVSEDKAIVLTVLNGETEKARLWVGKANGASTFTRLPGKTDVYATGGFIRSLVDKDPSVWRSKVITDIKKDDLAEISVKTEAGTVVLAAHHTDPAAPPAAKTGDKPAGTRPGKIDWSVKESPIKTDKLDEGLVQSVAAGMSGLRTNEFADSKKPEECGLDKPRSEVTAKLKDGKTVTLLIGAKTDKDESYVQVKDRPQIFVVKNFIVERYLTTPKNFGHKGLFSFTPDEVLAITIKGVEGGDVEITQEGVNWRMAKPKVGLADATKMKAMAASLGRLTAAAFVEDASAKTGLDKSTKEVVIKLKNTTHTLKIGDQVEDKPAADFYAQVVGSKDVVKLRRFNVNSLLKKGPELEMGAAPTRPPGMHGMPGMPGMPGPHGPGPAVSGPVPTVSTSDKAAQRAKLIEAIKKAQEQGGVPPVAR